MERVDSGSTLRSEPPALDWARILYESTLDTDYSTSEVRRMSQFFSNGPGGCQAVEIGVLQRLNLLDLQKRLTDVVIQINKARQADPKTMDEVDRLTKSYIQAIRDMVFMRNLSKEGLSGGLAPNLLQIQYPGPGSPFPRPGAQEKTNIPLAISSGLLPAHTSITPQHLPEVGHQLLESVISSAKDDALEHKRFRMFCKRLWMAVFGGIALFAPMLIMTLHRSKVTALLTTGICTLTVAVLLAAVLRDANEKDIMGMTAAYAAVLVVFVGTSASGTGNG